MAASIEQKVDYLLKKIGYTASKTGIAEDSSLSGTKKAPFAEALPSPLVVPSTSIYGQSESIPSTPPGTTSGVVQVYGTATAFQMTEDNTVSGKRAWLARSVQGDNTSDMVGDWIDTQFGPDYIINVYAGDPNAGGTKLSAAGSGSNDTWFFDYSSGVLNFNGDAAPTAITGGADVYLVGYRYTGLKGTSGAGGSFNDLNVTGIATFASDINANGDIIGDGSTNISGINSVTATEYYGDGSNLTGVVAAASVGISSNGDYVGAAFTTLDYREGDNTEVEVVAVGSTAQVIVDLKSDVTIGGSFTASDLYGTVRGPAVNVETLTVSGDSSLADVQVSGALTTTGPATLGAGSTMLGTGYVEHLEVRSGATINGVTTFTGDVNFEGSPITGTIEQAERAFRLDAPLTPGTNNVSFALPLVETPGLDTSFVTTQEVTYNPATGILTAPSANFSENVSVVGVLTAGTLYVDNPLEDVVITNAIITGVATVAGDFEAQSNVQIGGDLTVAGTITYEDVTDIDSIGIVTARSGIHVLTGGIDVQAGVVTSADGFDTAASVSAGGSVTAANFYGDGSNLTGLEDALNGGDVTFDNVQVGGALTVTGATDLNGDLDVDGHTELDGVAISGVTTATGLIEANGGINVNGAVGGDAGIVTTGDLASGGPITIGDLNVTGVSTFAGLIDADGGLEVAGGATIDGGLTSDNINNTGVVTSATYNVGSTAVLQTVDGQVALTGIATLDATTKATIEREIALSPNDFASLNITGLSTFAGLADFNGGIEVDGGSTLDELNVTGVATVGGTLDANGGAELSGGVVADELTVVGFTTVGGDLLANSNLDVTDQTTLNTLRVTGVTTFVSSVQIDGDITAGGDITGDGSTSISGINSVTATEFYGDGSNLTGLGAGLDGLNVTLGDVSVGGALTVTGATDLNGDLDVDGHTELDELRVSGVSTFQNGVNFNDNIAVTGQTTSGSLVVNGASTLTGEVSVGSTLTVIDDIIANGNIEGNGATNIIGINDLASTGTAALGSVTASGTLNVTGETTLSDVSVGAALTVAGTISANGDIEGDGATNISGINSVTATEFYGDGSGITNINSAIDGLDIAPRHINAAGFATVAQGLEVTSGGADITGLTTVTGDLYVTGNTTLGDADSDTLTVNADVASDLIPDGNNTRDLGAISDRWANVYAGEVNTTTLDVANNVTIGGNLSVGGTITSAELIELDIIAPVIELGLESVGDGTLQPPSSQTNYSSGTAMWYNRVGVSSDNAQAAAIFADLKPTGTYRIGFATDVTIGSGDVLGAVNGWAEIEAGALWMNDCAGESVVINCTGTERFLNNITVDGGTF